MKQRRTEILTKSQRTHSVKENARRLKVLRERNLPETGVVPGTGDVRKRNTRGTSIDEKTSGSANTEIGVGIEVEIERETGAEIEIEAEIEIVAEIENVVETRRSLETKVKTWRIKVTRKK